MRALALPVLCILIPACGGQQPADTSLGWNAPSTLADSEYALGHPVALNASQDAALEDSHYAAVSAYRGGLSRDLALEAVARAHSKHMATHPFFAHVNPEGDDLRMRCYRASGAMPYIRQRENLYAGTSGDAMALLSAFLASPAHKENLDATDVNAIGIGIWKDGATYYVTYDFLYR